MAVSVVQIFALDDEAVGRRESGQVDIGESADLAEDDIGLAGIDAASSRSARRR